ncbi:hypothetical protein Bbelb_192810 [Branchiostoma belcheri]|nr:hypothetical protein Bbelb_192810 [Branchiostoma belcheri]
MVDTTADTTTTVALQEEELTNPKHSDERKCRPNLSGARSAQYANTTPEEEEEVMDQKMEQRSAHASTTPENQEEEEVMDQKMEQRRWSSGLPSTLAPRRRRRRK